MERVFDCFQIGWKGRVSGHLFVEVLPEGFADGHHAVVLVPVLPGERHLVLGEEAKFNTGLIQPRLQKLF